MRDSGELTNGMGKNKKPPLTGGGKEVSQMMYPFLTLEDQTEIVHSEMMDNGSVKVYVEKPDEKDFFHNAVCWLPGYKWEDIQGFTKAEIANYEEIIRSMVHLIMEFSQKGGLEGASNF